MKAATKFEAALAAVKAYDAFLFASFGGSFNSDKADVLAFHAAEAWDAAARDVRENQATRAHARSMRDQFRAIYA